MIIIIEKNKIKFYLEIYKTPRGLVGKTTVVWVKMVFVTSVEQCINSEQKK